MARALFQSWFVDFDPVRAKAEGRDPGLPRNIAELFPVGSRTPNSARFQGWGVGSSGRHFRGSEGCQLQGRGLGDEGMPLHNLTPFTMGGGYKYEGIKYYSRGVRRSARCDAWRRDRREHRAGSRPTIDRGTPPSFPCTSANAGNRKPSHLSSETEASELLTSAFLLPPSEHRHGMHDLVSGYANGTTVNMHSQLMVFRSRLCVPAKTLGCRVRLALV
jgi:type I restriction enzyme S subunit